MGSLQLYSFFDLFIEADKTELVMVWCPQGSQSVYDLISPRLFSSRSERSAVMLQCIVGEAIIISAKSLVDHTEIKN